MEVSYNDIPSFKPPQYKPREDINLRIERLMKQREIELKYTPGLKPKVFNHEICKYRDNINECCRYIPGHSIPVKEIECLRLCDYREEPGDNKNNDKSISRSLKNV